MELKTFYAPGVSHFSYMILANGQALVIDPQRDIEAYLRTAVDWQAPIGTSLLPTTTPTSRAVSYGCAKRREPPSS